MKVFFINSMIYKGKQSLYMQRKRQTDNDNKQKKKKIGNNTKH